MCLCVCVCVCVCVYVCVYVCVCVFVGVCWCVCLFRCILCSVRTSVSARVINNSHTFVKSARNERWVLPRRRFARHFSILDPNKCEICCFHGTNGWSNLSKPRFKFGLTILKRLDRSGFSEKNYLQTISSGHRIIKDVADI